MPIATIRRFTTLCALPAGMFAAAPVAADILIYAQNDCRGAVAFRYPAGRAIKESCKSDRAVCRGKNDQARSLRVTGTSRPTRIYVYDGPGGGTDDDYSEIQFRKYKPGYRDYCVTTFERSGLLAEQGQIRYERRNGLDGKVSYVVIHP